MESVLKEKTCCFTGHRSRDLPFEGDRSKMGVKHLVSTVQLKIKEAVADGYDTFITGMADGIDLICAEAVHELITHGAKLNLLCAMPYPEQVREIKTLRDRYLHEMLTELYPTVFVSPCYSKDCYRLRNQYMVERASRLIGVVKDKQKGSGTMQTIRMAQNAGLDCRIIRLDGNPVFYLGDE